MRDSMTVPRVLFVDDEPRILDGLRRSLRGKRRGWELTFAGGGAHARELLAHGSFDVVVSDMRMPGMDGAELLSYVSRNHPEVARVVLSGHIEPEAIIKVAVASHRFLSKPSDVDGLIGVVEQLLIRTSAGHQSAARRLAGAVPAIPVLPQNAHELNALQAPEADLSRAVRLASNDIGLTAKVLQLTNSRVFGPRPRNSSVESIVHAIGLPMIQSVAAAGQRLWPHDPWAPGSATLLETTWRHAVATASLVEQVASPANRPHAHAAALLQDVGRLVCLAVGDGDGTADLDLEAGTRDGVPFRDVGVELLHLWGVPMPVITAVAQRDTPQRPEASGLGVASALRAAHLLIQETDAGDPVAGTHPSELGVLLSHPQLQARPMDWRQAAEDASRHAELVACGSGG